MNFNQFIEFPDLVLASADAAVRRQWRGGNFHACGHSGQQMAMFLSFTSRCQARRPFEMQGVFISWLLNQLKTCKGTVDQLLFIYFYSELMNSVKFHNGQMNTVFVLGIGVEEDPNLRRLGRSVLFPAVAF